ncbi:Rha family transcriptional regulator [Prevotella copri]|uniref:Rha family transcriptional regulator n=1 Tax=Segatella copri TaxID=165179 RepID=A0A6A7VZR8_9BACT|nr:Rha family transcriptional regulator [Segatella copri]MQM58487.1 Rha family transcriptional regulator [Segatella copri]MQN05835.1 Rha family transcriptional regulator [Segatella copri]MQN10272.1 Rha family transcriptional regulator [Segatella copri]MQO61284.1 Rha family transcriptional regulator [Segatella copri]MQO64038.1 Rha family transcriptional regulator [Segatella copri]
MNEIVFRGANDQAVTSSLLIAEKFGKEHKNVMQSIRNLIGGTAENSAIAEMFSESTYLNEQNKEQPMFLMNRDGFTLLAMGFTGKKAMQFKLEYIKAFNSMEAQIKASQKPKSQLEILQMSINQLVEQEHRLSSVERDVAETKKEIAEMKQERIENGKLLLEAEVSENKVPEISMRNKIRRLVNQYAAATNTSQRDIWHLVYDNLLYAYNIGITRYNRKKGQSYLDVAEEHGFLGKIFDIVSKVVNTNKDKM